eukprot:TRINITY_DN3715_c0_g1_i1.p1 TRINITY_DN3715_c0_g1~~TRINITY_DN3715_c0_g1_i1.p1  ORF type:complete len:230 (+),score=26.80 TRINITY_DN3715_c0_g1_i1:69-758(+)
MCIRDSPNSLLEFMTDFWHCYITNATFSVEIFFYISGFLAFYLIHCECKKQNGSFSFWRIYLHRFLRIAPLYYFAVHFYTWILAPLVEGPVSFLLTDHNNISCNKTWWISMLFYSNLIKHEQECAAWLWYVPNVMQFFLLVPPLALIYYYSRKWGGIILGILVVIATSISVAVSQNYKMSASLMKFSDAYFQYFYEQPYSRISPYLLGIFTAMIYLAYKEGQDLSLIHI